MITSLQIQGLAIIESLHIDFSPGFNVITGETGAGKSILIRALNFLIGTKASSEAVRKGFDSATVIGEFYLSEEHQAISVLRDLSIPFEIENGKVSLLVRRVLNVSGRSSAWINDTSVSLQGIRDVGMSLIDVFGQHENQKLLNPKWHLKYVDSFLEKKELKDEYRVLYQQAHEKLSEIEHTVSEFLTHQKDQDYIRFRLEELKDFAPEKADYEECLQISKTSGSGTKIKESLSKAVECLENEESGSLSSRLWETAKVLSHSVLEESLPTEIPALRTEAQELAEKVETLSFSLTKLLGSVDIDEEALERAEKRVFGYQSLLRKHGAKEIEDLLLEMQRLQTLSSSLEAVSLTLLKELKELEKMTDALKTLALGLSKARMKAALFIKRSVERELSDLSMNGARFDTHFNEIAKNTKDIPFEHFDAALKEVWEEASSRLAGLSAEGQEEGEFLLASNPGESTLPLARIASGGELSRIMLALKKAIATDAQTCVLVFDEIDTGISGRIADVVGQKMQELSDGFQVICISHLPQVAVYADTHFLVKKEEKGEKAKRTESSIIRLSPDDSAREIARLLSGENVSKLSLANAEHLISQAKERKGKNSKSSKPKTATKKKTKETRVPS